jgi:DNA invertase Pin-like site-specific DNA recombinase
MKKIVNEKIEECHLVRKAVIYIRQSSERQVQHHIESGRLQYELTDRANVLGWANPIIINEDLGKSADIYYERSGFQSLVTRVSMGNVGIVLSFEATRLARNNRDWYHLIDLCTIFDTLLGDHHAIYDPKDPNDRLLLGIKGTMSEAELNLIKFRMRQGRLSKARRGALYTTLPPGYSFDVDGLVEKSPDIREQEAIELIFKKFKELGSARQTHLWFVQENISVPVNSKRDIEGKKRRWQLPAYSFILQFLHNPFYAGAYVYGRRGSRVFYEDGHIKKTNGHFKKPEEWEVFIKDHHEGYISWEQYEENIFIMKNNQRTGVGDEAVGAIRNGKGLLGGGLLRCQRCGRKMHVRYWGKGGTNPRYVCEGDFPQGGNYCQSFSGSKTDRVFEEELFKAIEPASIQASVEACEVVNQKYQDKIRYLEKELENAQYEANRAFTQYNQVDPNNRLVASELERRWNDKLDGLNEVRERIEKEKSEIKRPTQEEILKVKSLSDRLPEIWRHPETDPAIKKRIIRMLVEEVLIHLDEEKPLLTMTIHWKGGVHTQVQFKKPVNGDPPPNKTQENIVELLGNLAPHYPDEEIARIFNCHKFKTGHDNPWTRTRVRGLRVKNNIAPFDRNQKRDVLSLNEAAKRLEVNCYTIRELIKRGLIKSKQIIKHAPFEIESSELEKEIVKKVVRNLRAGQALRSMAGVNQNQISIFQ